MFVRILKAVTNALGLRNALPLLSTPEFQADVEHNTRRWDDEWLFYWVSQVDAPQYFINRRNLDAAEVEKHRPRLKGLSEEEFFEFDPLGYAKFNIWAKGDWIENATIAELGCGPGMLGKAVGPFCKQYIGIDYSKLALHVARLTSPANCRYLHLSELKQLKSLGGTCDLCAGRAFFIHQNWQNARWVLQLHRHLLKKGGRVCADFFAPSSSDADSAYSNSWMVRTPEDPLLEEHPSSTFAYTEDHIRRLAQECGFTVESIDHRPKYQRRFAILVK